MLQDSILGQLFSYLFFIRRPLDKKVHKNHIILAVIDVQHNFIISQLNSYFIFFDLIIRIALPYIQLYQCELYISWVSLNTNR